MEDVDPFRKRKTSVQRLTKIRNVLSCLRKKRKAYLPT